MRAPILVFMPPKLSEEQIDGKLAALRDYVRNHRLEFASRDNSSLKALFAGQRNKEETSFYLFLHKNEARFKDAQRRHARETLALVTQQSEISGGAHPAARAALQASSSGVAQPAGGVSQQQ